jgi:hypothetical protein
MKWPWVIEEEILRRAATHGEWGFVLRKGILAWGVPMLKARVYPSNASSRT